MSASQFDEGIKSEIGCLVEVCCLGRDIPFSTHGSWTPFTRARRALWAGLNQRTPAGTGVLPGLDLVLLTSFVDRPKTAAATQGFREALRGN